ncbi:hypothetical protein TWF281_007885 [Arthrobotrys megalospora]
MVVFHQSASKRRRFELLHSYLDWTAAHDRLSFAIFSMDAVLTTMYFAISVFMTVYYFATADYLRENAVGVEGLPKVIRLLKARAGITVAISYLCLCSFYWLTKRLFVLPGATALLTTEIDRKYEMYLRMYAIIVVIAILRIATFILACPRLYPKEIMNFRIPHDDFVAKPLISEREDKTSDFIISDIIVYFWGWSFVFLITALITLGGFLINSDFVGFIIHPRSVHNRTKYEIFDLVFFTATQPLWTTFDLLLLLCEVFECLVMCIFELLLCRKPQPMSRDEYSERLVMGKIRSPRYYNEPKLSASYYWAGRGWYKSIRLLKQLWHMIKTSVLGMWFGAKWWAMKVKWGIKMRRSRASGMTVILGPHQSATIHERDRGDVDLETGGGAGTSWGNRTGQLEDIELGDLPGRTRTSET